MCEHTQKLAVHFFIFIIIFFIAYASDQNAYCEKENKLSKKFTHHPKD